MFEQCRARSAEAGVTPAVVSAVAGDKLQWSIFIIQYTINNKGLHHLQHSHLHFWFVLLVCYCLLLRIKKIYVHEKKTVLAFIALLSTP